MQHWGIWYEAINAIAVVVLVIVTAYYARTTARILKESQRSTKAIERQATAMEEGNRLLRQQIEELADLGNSIVKTGIESTVRRVAWWKSANVQNMAGMHTIPERPGLVPENSESVIQHARRLAPQLASDLAEVFDNLRIAETVLEGLRMANDTLQSIRREGQQFIDLLNNADEKLAEIDISLRDSGSQGKGKDSLPHNLPAAHNRRPSP